MPYWSDRVSSKLAENTNTAWGGSLKTRDKPLIHGVLLLWKSPGGSCISSAFSKPLPSSGSAVSCCNVSVMVAFRKETHVHANESQADLSNASSFRSARARANHFFLFVCLFSRWGEGRSWWPSVHRCNFIPRLQLRNQSPRFTTTTAESTNLFIPPNFSVLLSKAEQLSQGSHLPVIPGWLLLCLSAIPTNNASQ